MGGAHVKCPKEPTDACPISNTKKMIAPIEEIVMRMDFRYQKIYKIKETTMIMLKCFGKVEITGDGSIPENIEIVSNNEVSIIGQDIENVENITAYVDFI